MPRKTQLNIRMPESLVERIRADARRSGRSIDAVMETIISDFLRAWTVGERGKFYATRPVKRQGRPLETEVAS